MNENINYYELLGVSKNATKDEIKKAYRIQAKKWHPDLNKDEQALEISKKINEAKVVLLDDLKRKDYDNYLNNLANKKYQKMQDDNIKNTNSKSTYSSSYSEEYSSEKTYTKWEYFQIYLKYYQVSKKRKALAIILVILETILCSSLGIINYLLALIINVSYSAVAYLSQLIIGLYTFFLIFAFFSNTSYAPSTIGDYIEVALIYLGLILLTIIPVYILKFLIYKMPTIISDLNMYLFKKAIGYDN